MNLRVFYLTRRGLSDGYNSLGNIFSAFRQCVSKWKADKAFFNDNATGQPKEEGSNATLNPAPSSIFKMVGFRRIPCRPSLATSVDVDRITLRNSGPLLFSESRTRHERIWDETRPNLGRGTTERGAAFADRYRLWIGGLPCLQTNGLCKIRQAPTSFTNSKYPQILNSLPYIAIRPARDAYSFFVD